MAEKRAPNQPPSFHHQKRVPGARDDQDDEIDSFLDMEEEDVAMQMPPAEDDMDVDLGEAGRNWVRPPVSESFDAATSSLIFQQVEVDYLICQRDEALDSHSKSREVPVVRLFGVNDEGNSVCAFIHGFEHYFYAEKPQGWGDEAIEDLRNEMNKKLSERTKGSSGDIVTSISIEKKSSIWGYHEGDHKDFLKISTSLPNHVATARGLVENGIRVGDYGTLMGTSYESNVIFAMRFMVDLEIVGGNWVELPKGSYRVTNQGQGQGQGQGGKHTYCQIEVHASYKDLISHPPEGKWARMAPLRVLSFDIECAGRKGHFPEAKLDPVIQIASMVTVQGQSQPVVKNVMTLNTCASIVGAEVMPFEKEEQLLLRWRDLLLESDPDVIIGYNITNFDLPYLYERAQTLGIDKEFHQWGRVRGSRTRMKDTVFSSKAHGTHEYKDLPIDGRVQLDLLTAIQREHKLASYSLNAVSAHFLNEQKEDVHHSCITDLQNGTDETRRRLAVYCLKDAYLPQRLLDKLMFMYNYMEMARVTGVPMSYLLTRGQSIKVFSQILRKARHRGYIIPNIKYSGPSNGGEGVAYEGATVLDPKTGYYDRPVATLDFASLYPSIMMAHNLCYTTLVSPDKVKGVPMESIEKSPSGDWFVKSSVQKGILPEILEELLAARKRAKNDLKNESDPFKRAVLDGRQLALKISANSVYGFTGATVGKMPCLQISASTTSYGRSMIMNTRELVMKMYTKANGYEADCDVIYGDTDSVMVNFGVQDVKRAMELGREAAAAVSKTFPPPVKLEFEKVYFPYLLMNKKRYAGLLWTKEDKHDKIDSKGIETVRRDNCLLVRNVITTCLDKILINRDVSGAVHYVKGVISELLMNKIDLSLLVISKGLSQDAEEYEGKAAHVELAKKMKKRDPATAPNTGDRVPYVIIKAAKGAKAYEKAEDPIYALEHNLPIDVQHYLEHHLSQPLIRIFEAVMKNPKELLSGDHTRSILVSTPTVASGGIMKFAKVRLSCLGCKAPLGKEDMPEGDSIDHSSQNRTPLCKHCRSKEAEIYQKSLHAVNELESNYGALWTQCQRCQGSLHQEVLCTSRDCPIFYRRKKVQKDLNEAQSHLLRFQDEDATW